MKTKAIIVDVSEMEKSQQTSPYGAYRIFVFEKYTYSTVKNYLESFGIKDVETYYEEYYVGMHPCHIIAELMIDKACIDNLSIILDKTISLKIDEDTYKGTSYTVWVNTQVDINAFMEG